MKHEVIYRHSMGSGEVRFVKSPLARLDIPWVVVGDMLTHAGVHQESLQSLIASMRGAAQTQTISLDDAIETIAPIWTLFHLRDALGLAGSPGKIIVAAVQAAYPDMTVHDRVAMAFAAPSLIGKEL